MSQNKINKLKAYLNNSGFKKEAYLLALLGMVACKSPNSYDFTEEISLFSMSKLATLDHIDESIRKLNYAKDNNGDIVQDGIPQGTFQKAINAIRKYAREGKLYKKMELSYCYTAEKVIPTDYDFEVEDKDTRRKNPLLLGDFRLQFSCMPVTTGGLYYSLGGNKIYLSEEEASIINRDVNVTYNEDNPMEMYIGQQDSVSYSGTMTKDEEGNYTNMEVPQDTFVALADISRIEIGDDEYFVFHRISAFLLLHKGLCSADWLNHSSSDGSFISFE